MKKQISFLISLMMIILSCSHGDTGDNDDENKLGTSKIPVNILGSVTALQARAMDATWEANDKIGVFMLKSGTSSFQESTILENANNICYITSKGDGKFNANTSGDVIYFPSDGSNADFYAYYPYQKNLDNAYTLNINVSDQSNQSQIDILYANNVKNVNQEESTINFNFKHQLSKIVVNLQVDQGMDASILENSSIRLTNQQIKASFFLSSGTLSINNESSEIIFKVLQNTAAFEAILLPSPAKKDVELVITLQNGRVYRYPIPADRAFIKGEKYTYNVLIKATGIDVSSSITNWQPGNGNNGENIEVE